MLKVIMWSAIMLSVMAPKRLLWWKVFIVLCLLPREIETGRTETFKSFFQLFSIWKCCVYFKAKKLYFIENYRCHVPQQKETQHIMRIDLKGGQHLVSLHFCLTLWQDLKRLYFLKTLSIKLINLALHICFLFIVLSKAFISKISCK